MVSCDKNPEGREPAENFSAVVNQGAWVSSRFNSAEEIACGVSEMLAAGLRKACCIFACMYSEDWLCHVDSSWRCGGGILYWPGVGWKPPHSRAVDRPSIGWKPPHSRAVDWPGIGWKPPHSRAVDWSGIGWSNVSVVLFDTPWSPGVGRNTLFLSSPHLCFIIVFISDLFVPCDEPLMS